MLACALREEGGVRIDLEKGVANPFSEEQGFWGRGEEGGGGAARACKKKYLFV